MASVKTVADLRHPLYTDNYRNWQLWRDTYAGGQRYVDRYLSKFNTRESAQDYTNRLQMTYNPAFAREAVDEVKNSIFQRLVDVSRKAGSVDYQRAIQGFDGGVDLLGSSMNAFVGRKVLPELLTMAKVGIYVDMPQISGVTMADARGARPYIYFFRTEDITNWSFSGATNGNEFSNVLLREYYDTYDDETGLPQGTVSRFRRMWLGDGGVYLQFYDEQGAYVTSNNVRGDAQSPIFLDIPKIPFVVTELSQSLLNEAARYQVALLNLASSDISYALNANFPFYTEMFEPRGMNEFTRKPGSDQGGEAADASSAKTEEVKVGVTRGRRYPKGMDRPGFIAPPSDPLKASMEKQSQMKMEIRLLVNLAVMNLTAVSSTATVATREIDQLGLETGLSCIGLELENMERSIAQYWAMYEGKSAATVNYPTSYKIMSDSERRAEAKELLEILPTVPSRTFQKAIAKRVAELIVGRQVSLTDLETINREIDESEAVTTDPSTLVQDVEAGVLSKKLAAKLRGYPADTVEDANTEHADRLARIAKTQTPNNGLVNGAPGIQNGAQRGAGDLSADFQDPKVDPSVRADAVPVRGDGRNTNGR
jgi:hypothetical protein